jgi:type II secretory pathway pseudopilin PulG
MMAVRDDRRGFTRLELIFIVGIIAILAGVILIFSRRTRHDSDLELQQADFQVISAGLEAYKSDFGDYPRNRYLPTWNTQSNGPTPAPVFYPLAPALLGPGPAVTEPVNGVLQVADGADGPGFRAAVADTIFGTASAEIGKNVAAMTVDVADAEKAAELAKDLPKTALFTLLSSPAEPFPETVGIRSAVFSGNQLRLTLASELTYSHNGKCSITVPTGKIWGPYVSSERFKISFVPSVDSYGSPFFGYGQPVLLDRWMQVIEYFPRYDNNNSQDERSGKVFRPRLFGFSQSQSIDPAQGESATFDWRDGAPFFTVIGQTGPAQSWPNPRLGAQTRFRPELAIEWMLKGGSDVQYFLISAGPAGLEQPNGGFCNFADSANGSNSLPDNVLEQTFTASGNIYYFARR